MENQKNIVCFSNTGPDPLENLKATKAAFIVLFKCSFAVGPIMTHY